VQQHDSEQGEDHGEAQEDENNRCGAHGLISNRVLDAFSGNASRIGAVVAAGS
jgi:hypothetical protein